jgi:adenosylmethionine---8-amino-7-oxononanoate aminotransferase
MKKGGIFITATDTDAGKTVASLVLGVLLQDKGLDIGVMKPVQCAGQDAFFLKEQLGIQDSLSDINPYFAQESLSPHLAFSRAKKMIRPQRIKKCFDVLYRRHDFLIVEGVGGLLVPIKKDYFVADLIRDLGLEVVIVSRLGLGAINHSLLTIEQAKTKGLGVRGILFNQHNKGSLGLPEKTNPCAIHRMSGVPLLGTIPFLKEFDRKTINKQCRGKINLDILLRGSANNRHEKFQRDDRDYVWHPFTQMQDWIKEDPLIIEQARGCYLKDTQGQWYLDGVSSLWVNVHGHQHPLVNRAVQRQLHQVSHSTMLGLSNVPAIQLARQLVDMAPRGLRKVFYSDSGSTAVEIAIKMAYQYWQNTGQKQKKKIIHLAHSYHGDTLGSVSVGGIGLFHQVYRDLVFDTIQWPTPVPDAFGDQKKFQEDFLKSIKDLDVFLKEHHQEIAAFIVEPLVQGAAGMIVWPSGILRRLAQLCRQHDVLFVADEVATGFGRTGKMFACEHETVRPDILCLAKGISAGYLPLAATLTTQRIYQGFLFDYKDQKTFFHGHTYTGNPLACAAALANLEVFKKERTLEKLAPKIKTLQQFLKSFRQLVHVGDVRQKGLMVGVELVKDKVAREEYTWEEQMGVKVCQQIRKYGVILRPLGNVIVMMPPLSIGLKDLKKLTQATYRAIREVTERC